MRRTLQIAAVFLFVAVLVILLTPADDGPVMSLAVGQVVALGLLVALKSVGSSLAPSLEGKLILASDLDCTLHERVTFFLLPLLC